MSKKNYTHILFDLDGTLTDSALGIINAVIHALHGMGVTDFDTTSLTCFIGPPLRSSFPKYFGFDEAQTKQALAFFREYYHGHGGMFENKVYDGIPQLLYELRKRGKCLIVATCKPQGTAMPILEHFELTQYFDFIAGAGDNNTRMEKDEVIEYAIELAGITDRNTCVMVGDRNNDVFGAKSAGIDCIGVLYGFGSREELETAGATYIAEDMNGVLEICSTQWDK